ncbi:helix-turn-helix domain-containing protein [Microvirga ossetica]|uniref:AlbA family DNA-binding domain-containing protein n=1 Tax=Microvirga ossetica TaxID=1882682 RepID=UPI0012FFEE9F|nr:ATP-binding protein [Microvirga ossetica]
MDAEARETNELEFKGTLPFKPEKGQPQTADRWIEKGDRIGPYARDQILAEVVAFANAEGGTLVLGLHETRDHPRRAERLEPLPKCEDLARRLIDATEDTIEPRLAMVEAKALPVDDAGAGYVVMRVGKSLMAPHRLTSTRDFYIRRGERAAVMDVREIRDLTLSLARTGDRIEQVFQGRQKDMRSTYGTLKSLDQEGNIHPLIMRATALPTTPHTIAAVTSRQDLWWQGRGFSIKVGEQQYSCEYPARKFSDLPKIHLRSLQSSPPDGLVGVSRLLTGDALIEFRLAHKRRQSKDNTSQRYSEIYATWIIGLVAGALSQVDRLRSRLAWDAVEFGLEFEMLTAKPAVLQWADDWDFGDEMSSGSVTLPRYSVGPRSEFNDLVRTIMQDLSNAAGVPWDYPCELPWQELLT